MIHRYDLAAAVERHAELLDRRRAERVEACIVRTGQHQLYRLAKRLGGERSRHGVIAVQAPAEAAADQIRAQYDPFLRHAECLRKHWQNQALPLIAGMNFEDAVLFEGKGVNRLELVVHHAAGRIGSLQLRFRALESRVEPLVVDQQDAAIRVSDLGRAMIEEYPVRKHLHRCRRSNRP